MSPSIASQLAPLIGLDEQTVSEQILPHLSTITSAQEIKNYLLTLLAPGKPSQEFISSYLSHRFPSSTSQPSSTPSTRWATPTTQSRSNSPLPSSSRIYEQEKRKEEIEGAFRASGGKVYRKNGEEDSLAGWGGNTSGRNSRNPSTSRAPTPVQPNQTTRTGPSTTTTSQAKGKSSTNRTVSMAGVQSIELSEEATRELREIERGLKSFTSSSAGTKGKRSACFCSARQHPLSTYTPLCPSCALILCTLNSPTQPCPSCSHSPLLPPSLTASYVSDLTRKREELIEREKERFERKKREEEIEKRSIKFPQLGADYGVPSPGGGQAIGYAGHAGGGGGMGGLQERIQRGYEMGVSLNGRNFGKENRESQGGGGGGKVLRLDGKGKVKVETKRKKKVVKDEEVKKKEGGIREVEEEEEEEDDGMIPWIDPTDDGIRSAESSGEVGGGSKSRVFENVAMEARNRPVWIEREELSHSIVDEGDNEGGLLESVPDTGALRRERKAVVGAAAAATNGTNGGKKGKARK